MTRPAGPVGYAHRGFSLDGVENSLAAFAAAVELGFDQLETDARASADGVAVAFHDRMLDRLTNHHGPIAARDWAQLRLIRIYDREPVASLADVLGSFPAAEVNIDVKCDAAIGPTLDAIASTNAWRRVRLASFSHRRLVALRQAAGPAVATALSPPEVAQLIAAGASARRLLQPRIVRSGRAGRSGSNWSTAAQVPVQVGPAPVLTARFVEQAHARGIVVHAWTINQPSAMTALLDLGVDAIITDRVDLLREVLIERGQWQP